MTRTRNRCNGEGYESVALIPLRMGDVTIGLLQLNDRRTDRFTADLIRFFEGLGAGIGIALGRKQAEEELRKSEDKYRQLFSTVSDAIVILDAETKRFVDVNEAALKMYGYSKEEFLKRAHHDIMTEPEKPAETTRHVPSGRLSFQPPQYHKREDGTVFPVEVSASTFSLRGRTVFCAVIRDITERKGMEKALAEMAVRERRQFGQDLHDGLGQELTGLGYLAGVLHDQLRSEGHPQADLAARLNDSHRKAIALVRTIAKGLIPVEVDADGLVAALEQLASSVETRTAMSCRFQCDGHVEVDDYGVATELYRIAQEAIYNAVRHAQARRIDVTLTTGKGDRLCLRVRDDGVGLPSDLCQIEGLGLRIMQHRADLIGAALQIGPANGGGTEVLCVVKRDTTGTA
jgi:two-component system CheB/CheR fusion protein